MENYNKDNVTHGRMFWVRLIFKIYLLYIFSYKLFLHNLGIYFNFNKSLLKRKKTQKRKVKKEKKRKTYIALFRS